jgi:hypothetical protein
MLLLTLLLLCGTAVSGQAEPSRHTVKPDVDAALRARVAEFYQDHVDGKFSHALKLVADDSQDYFIAAPKIRYDSCKVSTVTYMDHFTRANVMAACHFTKVIQGAVIPITAPVPSQWKLVDGDWMWYIVPSTAFATPFGTMHPGPMPASGSGGEPPHPPLTPAAMMAAAAQILQQVTLDQKDVRLSSFEPAKAEVHIKNGMQGYIRISVQPNRTLPGFSLKLDKTDLGPGDTSTLLLSCDPKDKTPKPAITVNLTVEPTMQVIPITVTFAVPPGMIPKHR